MRKTFKLAGTSVIVEKDLSEDRRIKKQIMIKIKTDILSIDNKYKILVRDDRMKIEKKKWFRYNNKNEFVSDNENGNVVLDNMFKGSLKKLNFEFNYMFNVTKNNMSSKNF